MMSWNKNDLFEVPRNTFIQLWPKNRHSGYEILSSIQVIFYNLSYAGSNYCEDMTEYPTILYGFWKVLGHMISWTFETQTCKILEFRRSEFWCLSSNIKIPTVLKFFAFFGKLFDWTFWIKNYSIFQYLTIKCVLTIQMVIKV